LGKARKAEKAKEQKENCGDKENPATKTRKPSRALPTTHIHTRHGRVADSKEGDSLKEKFAFAFMLSLTEQSHRVNPI